MISCTYCGHAEPRDLIMSTTTTLQHTRWECRDQVMCAVRSGGLGRET